MVGRSGRRTGRPQSTFVLGSEGHTVHAPPSVMAALLRTPVAFPLDDARETWNCRRLKRVRQDLGTAFLSR